MVVNIDIIVEPTSDSDTSDDTWKSASDGEQSSRAHNGSPAPLTPSLRSDADATSSTSNSSSFYGHGNRGWQVGQNYGGNVAHTINVYNDRLRPTTFEGAAEYVQSLSSGYRQQKNANPNRTAGTCAWFLQDERFQQWREADQAHLLHVFAAPGCGKSVLARALIDEGLLANPQTAIVAYYFFKSGQGEQDRAFAALAAFLHQIYLRVPDPALQQCAQSRYEGHGIRLSQMFDELWDIFVDTVAQIQGNVVCVLDALDECVERDRKMLISQISSFYARAEGLPNLKLIVLSRPYRDVDFYPGVPRKRSNFIRFDGDDKSEIIAHEINMVIEDKIPELLVDLSEEEQQQITEYLQGMENRTYLWLYLIFEHVQRNIAFNGREEDIKRLMNEVPPEVDEAYEKMLSRSPFPELTRMLLSIVLAAERPLFLNELKQALKIAQKLPDDEEIDRSKMKMESSAQFQKSLKDLCGLLLSVRKSRVYFIHETAREFLLGEQSPETASCWAHTFDLEVANGLLTEISLAYLSCRTLKQTNEEITALSKYAPDFWTDHYENACEGTSEKLKGSLSRILEAEVEKERTVWAHSYKSPLLPKLSEAGFYTLAQLALNIGADVNCVDIGGNTALHIALNFRQTDMIPTLLRHDIDLSIRNYRGHTVFTDDIGFDPAQRLSTLIKTCEALFWQLQLLRRLYREFFRGAIIAVVLSRDTYIIEPLFQSRYGFVTTKTDVLAALDVLKATGYLEDLVVNLRQNTDIISAVGGTAAFDVALGSRLAKDSKLWLSLGIEAWMNAGGTSSRFPPS